MKWEFDEEGLPAPALQLDFNRSGKFYVSGTCFVLGFGQDNQGNVYVMATRARGPNGEQDKIYKIVP